MTKRRLAIVTTHPIQYYAPWFRWITADGEIELKAFYLWDTESAPKHDPGFGRAVSWDMPLIEGYPYEFVPNTSADPGSDRYAGICNPELPRRIRRFKPDAALLIGYRYASMMRLILTPETVRGYPLIFRGDSHRLNKQSGSLSSELKRAAISAIFRRFAAIACVGEANHDYFRRHGVPEEKLFFAPHAVDNAHFTSGAATAADQAKAWKRELGIPEEHLVILFAGKFEEKKRPLDLVRAFRTLGRDGVSLLLVGSGQLEAELRAEAAGAFDIYIEPFQNQSLMPRTYAACDLFVLPSYGPEESWGLAINEASCMGKPAVVSSHVGCAADLVRSGETGWVFEAGNVQALASTLREALSDRNRLKGWGAAARRLIDSYDYRNATAGLKAALQYALRKSDAGVKA